MKNILTIFYFSVFICCAQNKIEIHLDSVPGLVYNGETIVHASSYSSFSIPMHLVNKTSSNIEVLYRRVILESDVNFQDQFCSDKLCFLCLGNDWTTPVSTTVNSGDSSLMKPLGSFTAEGNALIRYYVINHSNAEILDSVDLKLIHNSCAKTSNFSHVACDSFTWVNGTTYYSSNNTANYTITNNMGCDTTFMLDLIILNSTSSIDSQTACNFFTWVDGITYSESTHFSKYTFKNANGCDSIVTLKLTILNDSVNVDFSADNNSLTAPPYSVELINKSQDMSNYNFIWNFGDGTTLESNDSLVFHEFDNEGIYGITLIAQDLYTSCNDTLFKPDFINCNDNLVSIPKCKFSASDTEILAETTINFLDQSQNSPTTWLWLFEGANPSFSIDQFPSEISYAIPGLYDVTLIASNIDGSDTLLKPDYINVGNITSMINNSDLDVKIYPNPINQNVNIEVENYKGLVYTEIYDLIGNLILCTNKQSLNLENISNGMYLFKIYFDNKIEQIKVFKD